MSEKNKKIFALAVILFAAPLVSGCFFVREEEKISDADAVFQQEVAKQEELEEVKPEEENLSDQKNLLYEDEELKLSFQYPQAWGELVQEDSQAYCLKSRDLKINGKSSFLSAINETDLCEFGVHGWRIKALFIEDQKFIDMLCDDSTEAGGCELKTNPTGVAYAKTKEDVSHFTDPEPEIVTIYYIFNPYSEYKGVVLSTGGDFADGAAVENGVTEEGLDAILESLEFLK